MAFQKNLTIRRTSSGKKVKKRSANSFNRRIDIEFNGRIDSYQYNHHDISFCLLKAAYLKVDFLKVRILFPVCKSNLKAVI